MSISEQQMLFNGIKKSKLLHEFKGGTKEKILAAILYCSELEELNNKFMKVIKSNGLGGKVKF